MKMVQEVPYHRQSFSSMGRKKKKRNLTNLCYVLQVGRRKMKMNLKHSGLDFFCQDYRTTRTNPKLWLVFLRSSHFVSVHSIAFQGASKMKKMYLMVRSVSHPNPMMVTILPEKYKANS